MISVEYINPYIEAVQHVFSTMLEAAPDRGEVRVTRTRDFFLWN